MPRERRQGPTWGANRGRSPECPRWRRTESRIAPWGLSLAGPHARSVRGRSRGGECLPDRGVSPRTPGRWDRSAPSDSPQLSNPPSLMCILCGRCCQPGRGLVKQVLSEAGNIVKKLVQANVIEIENPQFGLGYHRGVARVTEMTASSPMTSPAVSVATRCPSSRNLKRSGMR